MSQSTRTAEEEKLLKALRDRGVSVLTDIKVPYFKDSHEPRYITPDIVIPQLRLVIEVDGSHHTGTAEQVRKDRLRDKTLRQRGYEVQHVSNYLVRNEEELRNFADQIAGEYLQAKGQKRIFSFDPTPVSIARKEAPLPKKRKTKTFARVINKAVYGLKETIVFVLKVILWILVSFCALFILAAIVVFGKWDPLTLGMITIFVFFILIYGAWKLQKHMEK